MMASVTLGRGGSMSQSFESTPDPTETNAAAAEPDTDHPFDDDEVTTVIDEMWDDLSQ